MACGQGSCHRTKGTEFVSGPNGQPQTLKTVVCLLARRPKVGSGPSASFSIGHVLEVVKKPFSEVDGRSAA